jgi:aminoglycoside 6'-N-acetyltransferase
VIDMSVNPKIDPPQRRPAPDAVTLRPATPADVDLLKHWDRQPQVIAAKGDDDWQWEKELGVPREWREQLVAEVDGRPIGYVEIIDPSREDSQYWGSIADGYRAIDLWIGEADSLGRGYGTQIMNQAIARSFADPSVNTILVDPLETNLRAHRFYESLGFEYVVCRKFGDDCCFVYRLRRPGTATRDS